jgi:uncharacterized protein (DUF885 family)
MYLMGTDLIHRLRRELAGALGEEFSLRRFHDEFLSYGSIPVSLIGREILRKPEAQDPARGEAREKRAARPPS